VLERCRRSFRREGQAPFLAAATLGLLAVRVEASRRELLGVPR
jgi:hypothetical protein